MNHESFYALSLTESDSTGRGRQRYLHSLANLRSSFRSARFFLLVYEGECTRALTSWPLSGTLNFSSRGLNDHTSTSTLTPLIWRLIMFFSLPPPLVLSFQLLNWYFVIYFSCSRSLAWAWGEATKRWCFRGGIPQTTTSPYASPADQLYQAELTTGKGSRAYRAQKWLLSIWWQLSGNTGQEYLALGEQLHQPSSPGMYEGPLHSGK